MAALPPLLSDPTTEISPIASSAVRSNSAKALQATSPVSDADRVQTTQQHEKVDPLYQIAQQSGGMAMVTTLAPRLSLPDIGGGLAAFGEAAGAAAPAAAAVGIAGAVGAMGLGLASAMSQQQYANAAAADAPKDWTARGLSQDQWQLHVQQNSEDKTDPYSPQTWPRRQATATSTTSMAAHTPAGATTSFPTLDGLAIANHTGHTAPPIVGIGILPTPANDGLNLPYHTGHSTPQDSKQITTSYPVGEQPKASDLALASTTFVRGSDFPDESAKLNAANAGPGKWVYMPHQQASVRSADYQQQISGVPFGNEYQIDGRKVDGVGINADGFLKLIEAKGPGKAANMDEKWYTGVRQDLKQITDQAKIAEKYGGTVEVHVAEKPFADALRSALRGTPNVNVKYTAPE